MKIVGITNCPAGIAHTYMVAEALENKGRTLNYQIKIETQGASGVENQLTQQDIAEADYVILALGKTFGPSERARFAGKKIIELPISEALKKINTVFEDMDKKAVLMPSNSDANSIQMGGLKSTQSVMSHLMAGVSAALPFIIIGGLLIAIANLLNQFEFSNIKSGLPDPSFAWVLNSIGELGFTFMIPIMGAFIANSIGDKPAFGAAFLVTYLSNNAGMLGQESGAGFFGAVIIGLAIGYSVREMRKIRIGKDLQPLMGSVIIPFTMLFVYGLLTYYILGPVLGWLMDSILHLLRTTPTQYQLVVAFGVGCMLAFDMGGPINKTAWIFCFSLLDKQVFTWYAIVGVVSVMPPMAVAIAAAIRPKLFTKQERLARVSTFIVGCTVATEPAIPYALSAPLPMITANTVAGGVAGALTILFGIERLAPGIGIFDPLIGLMSPWYTYYGVLIVGLVINIALILILKGIWLKKEIAKGRLSLQDFD